MERLAASEPPEGGRRGPVDGSAAGLRLYGRSRGRKLRPAQQQDVETLLPRLALPVSAAARADPRTFFPAAPEAVWLEVGFGGGEHLAAQAAARRDIGMIGCEPFINGVAGLLGQIRRLGLENVRIHAGDARPVMESLADRSIGRAFVLFPDPWPKLRHHKRRFVCPANLDALARILEPGAELRIATDDQGYLRWILEHVCRHPAFMWLARRPHDWRERPEDWPATRYEQKALQAGRSCAYLRFVRTPGPAPAG